MVGGEVMAAAPIEWLIFFGVCLVVALWISLAQWAYTLAWGSKIDQGEEDHADDIVPSDS